MLGIDEKCEDLLFVFSEYFRVYCSGRVGFRGNRYYAFVVCLRKMVCSFVMCGLKVGGVSVSPFAIF